MCISRTVILKMQNGFILQGAFASFHSHGLTVSGDRSEGEESWLGVDGGVDVETQGGGAAE